MAAAMPYPDDMLDDDDDLAPEGYEDAVLLNQRLKAMLAQAELTQGNQGSSCPLPPLPGRQSCAPSVGSSNRSNSSSRPSARNPVPRLALDRPVLVKESTGKINRRKSEQRIQNENAGIAERLVERSKSSTIAGSQLDSRLTPRNGVSSVAINRRKFEDKVQQENAGLVSRLVDAQVRRTRSCGPTLRNPGDPKMPTGWSRGVGGRMMPPPKERWGRAPKYDAGEMNF